MSETAKIQSLEPGEVLAAAGMVAGLEFYRSYGYQEELIRERFEEALDDPRSELLVARRGPEILGVAWMVTRAGFDRSAYLRLLAVSASEQGSGLGRRLMERLEKRHLQPEGIFLLVTADNKAARGFYEHLGYRQTGLIEDYVKPGRTECIYFKRAISG